jgi:sugar phosphate isomerase/epimerase
MRTFAMDTAFWGGVAGYPLDVRCAMLADLGYDDTYLTVGDDPEERGLDRIGSLARDHGLGVAGVFSRLDLDSPVDAATNRLVAELPERVPDDATVEVAMTARDESVASSNPSGDDAAVERLEPVLDAAADTGATVALYPHQGYWLERIEDAVRLCERLVHPALGAVFCGYHWYAVDGTALRDRLAAAAPHLEGVNLCGSRKRGDGADAETTIEPLGQGTLDNFAVLAALGSVGYDGPVGVQGFGVEGDAYANLRQSLDRLRDIERRLDSHPGWGDLEWG